METCDKCMGTGCDGHPDSGYICPRCDGSGGVPEVDTSKEAVVYDPEVYAQRFDASAGEYMVFWNTYAALLLERDQLRREVEEARDKALEEAAVIVQEEGRKARKYPDELVAESYCDDAALAIRALKARP